MDNLGGSNLGKGPYNGFSAKQSVLNYKDGEQSMIRKQLRTAWNTKQAANSINGKGRIITPFRAVNNSGDYLSRQNYVCGGPNPNHLHRGGISQRFGSILSRCDGSGIAAASGNVKYVPDSSEYIRYRKQRAINNNYNDLKNGGYNNAAYTSIMAIRRR